VELVTNRTETHAIVDNSIRASFKDIFIQLSTGLPLTMEFTMGLIVGGALRILLLLIYVPLQCSSLDIAHHCTDNVP